MTPHVTAFMFLIVHLDHRGIPLTNHSFYSTPDIGSHKEMGKLVPLPPVMQPQLLSREFLQTAYALQGTTAGLDLAMVIGGSVSLVLLEPGQLRGMEIFVPL